MIEFKREVYCQALNELARVLFHRNEQLGAAPEAVRYLRGRTRARTRHLEAPADDER